MVKKAHDKRGLGRGLSALMSDVNELSTPGPRSAPDLMVPIEHVHPNPDQPRKVFSEEALTELSESIQEKGVIQPLIVRKIKASDSEYEIVAGERRWRASQRANLHEIPVIVRDFSDVEVLEIAIIENIQRADLNPIEEAHGYRQLMDKFDYTQEKMGVVLSKSRSHIANLLRLLKLPSDVQEMLGDGRLSMGHARALITMDNPSELAKQIASKGLSVREAERLSKTVKVPVLPRVRAEKDADTVALEKDLSAALGLKVQIDHKTGDEAGKLVIRYKDLAGLDDLCQLLNKGR
ncbi:MAG: ParB/RepB/Spo0J family partition protein [Halocynthiibacter sp.]